MKGFFSMYSAFALFKDIKLGHITLSGNSSLRELFIQEQLRHLLPFPTLSTKIKLPQTGHFA